MAVTAKGRSVMALFSSPVSVHSHRARLVLAEKGINVEVVDVDLDKPPEDLIDLNPYNTVPTLVDRELVLYDAGVITEYIDERYPHPPLMPVDPVSRARTRLALFRIERDWYSLAETLDVATGAKATKARKILRDSLTASADAFAASDYFLNDEMTLVDCAIAPLLWRLERYGVQLPKQAKAVEAYADRVFAMEAFQRSLSEKEREMRAT